VGIHILVTAMSEETPRTPVDELLDRAEENGCLEFSAIAELVEEHGLDEEGTEALYAEAQRRGITLAEDCSAQASESSESGEGTYTRRSSWRSASSAATRRRRTA
jgi:hypothetical protein